MEIALLLIVMGIIVGLVFNGPLGLAMILVGVVLAIWPHFRRGP